MPPAEAFQEEMVRRLTEVRDQIFGVEEIIEDRNSDARELAFAVLRLQALENELGCIAEDLALVAEGEKYVEEDEK